ncbi:NUDIX domain-containing protein [Halovenus rubra]|uniref:NUDIX domain-containing protein n=2 Tax=Halovenus rubra TaxID=869890 RepID=A0ACC7E0V4_9EURY|nr:NUDIX hydrolase [Halovenus rubra]
MADSDDIEQRLDYLRSTYGEFPVESDTYYHADKDFERVLRNHKRGVPGASRVWVERKDETLLVRTHGGPDGWGVPGGFIEPTERSDHAGEREVHEETGIDCEVFDVAYVHIAENRLEDGDCKPIEELGVAFLASAVGGKVDPQEDEIAAAKWWSALPDSSYPPASRLGPERL